MMQEDILTIGALKWCRGHLSSLFEKTHKFIVQMDIY